MNISQQVQENSSNDSIRLNHFRYLRVTIYGKHHRLFLNTDSSKLLLMNISKHHKLHWVII